MDATRLDEAARRHGIRLLVQFGSSVTGRLHPHSDLDVAVLLRDTPASLTAYADLLGDLQALFPGEDLDLAIINRADPLFLKQITARCALLYGSERDLHELKIYAFKRYQDHRRFLDLERQYVARTIRALAR